jgi:hypothetical protein
MTPMRANIVGPLFSATRISASIAACHSGSRVLSLRKLRGDVIAGILQRDERAAAGQRYRFIEPAVAQACPPAMRVPILSDRIKWDNVVGFVGIVGRVEIERHAPLKRSQAT